MNEPNPIPASTETRHHTFNWGIPLGLLAIILAVAGYLASRDQARHLRTDLSQKLTEFQSGMTQDQMMARGSKETSKQFEQRLTTLESQVATSKEQQLSLDVLYKDLSRDRDQWALAEIEQILLSVNQQLQLAGNVKASILGLETADTRLAQRDLPQFTRLRAAIAKDLAQLRSVPQVDYTGLSIELDNLVAGVDGWPLVSEATAKKIKPRQSSDQLHNFGQDILSELKNIVQIRRLDKGEPALLSPDQEYFLRQNLKLRLLSARLSLLNRDETNFTADITASEALLARYFNERDDAVADAGRELAKLSRIKVAPPLPGIENSLTTLQQMRQIGASN